MFRYQLRKAKVMWTYFALLKGDLNTDFTGNRLILQ